MRHLIVSSLATGRVSSVPVSKKAMHAYEALESGTAPLKTGKILLCLRASISFCQIVLTASATVKDLSFNVQTAAIDIFKRATLQVRDTPPNVGACQTVTGMAEAVRRQSKKDPITCLQYLVFQHLADSDILDSQCNSPAFAVFRTQGMSIARATRQTDSQIFTAQHFCDGKSALGPLHGR